MRGRAGRGGVVLVAVALATGCSGRPALQDVEPAMTQAVRTVAGPDAAVHRELFGRCGPSDERLDGLVLTLVVDVPPDSVDVRDVAAELRRTGLAVDVDSRDGPLLAVTSDDGWTADLWPGDDRTWRFTAVAEVDGDARTAGGPVQPCG